MFKVKGINSVDVIEAQKCALMVPLLTLKEFSSIPSNLARYRILTPRLRHLKQRLELLGRESEVVQIKSARKKHYLFLQVRDELRLLEMATRVSELVRVMRDNSELVIELNSGLKAIHVTKYQNGALLALLDTSYRLYGEVDGVSERVLQSKVGGIDPTALKSTYSFPYLDVVSTILQHNGVADIVNRA